MNLFFRQPHRYFWILGPGIFILGLFLREVNLDINVHDSYFVISWFHVCTIFSTVLVLMGLGYWIFYRLKISLSYKLNAAHILITTLGPFCIWLPLNFMRELFPVTDFNSYLANAEFHQYLSLAALAIILITLAGQLIFVVNLIISVIRFNNSGV